MYTCNDSRKELLFFSKHIHPPPHNPTPTVEDKHFSSRLRLEIVLKNNLPQTPHNDRVLTQGVKDAKYFSGASGIKAPAWKLITRRMDFCGAPVVSKRFNASAMVHLYPVKCVIVTPNLHGCLDHCTSWILHCATHWARLHVALWRCHYYAML